MWDGVANQIVITAPPAVSAAALRCDHGAALRTADRRK